MKRKKVAIPRRTSTESGISFDGWEKMSPKLFHTLRTCAQGYYYQEWTGKALVDHVYVWMKSHGYSAQEVTAARSAVGMSAIPENLGAWCKILDDGCPDYNASHAAYLVTLPGITGQVLPITEHIHKTIAVAIKGARGEVGVTPTKVKATPNIQDRVKIFKAEFCGDIDAWLDTWTENPKKFNPDEFNVLRNLQEKDLSAFYATHVMATYAGDHEDIIKLLQLRKKPTEDDEDLQLLEAYEHHTTASLNKLLKAYQMIVDACNVVKAKKKVGRKPRKAKPVNVQKVEAKIKYMKSHDGLKLVSVSPLDIVGAQEVWVFNTKTRMLGHYFANDHQTLAIKGTTIQNINEVTSIEKKLRKPEEQLREFKACGKVALKKFMDGIRAKAGTMTGRLNKDTIIMKVIQ